MPMGVCAAGAAAAAPKVIGGRAGCYGSRGWGIVGVDDSAERSAGAVFSGHGANERLHYGDDRHGVVRRDGIGAGGADDSFIRERTAGSRGSFQ